MIWVLTAVATVVACELILLLPFPRKIATMARMSRRSGRVLSSKRISDHWKEKVLPAYALRLGGASLALLGMILLLVLPFVLAGLLAPGGLAAFLVFLAQPLTIVALLVGSLAYVWLRSRMRSGGEPSDYSAADRILHRVALGAPVLPEMIHDIEKARFLGRAPQADDGRHVFICGLARAGTTVLTRELYRSGEFGSLTYRDMPFVLAPNLWRTISKSNRLEAKERAHGDGLEVDLDSPEALDEVYWRQFCGGEYIRGDALVPHTPDAEALDGYADLIRLVLLKTGRSRYLSKNNNNILRLPALVERFPQAQFLIPVREPVAHAESLMRQHLRFENAAGFERDYVRWLGHHEFGATHLPFVFDTAPPGTPRDLDYWLAIWLDTHRHLRRVAAGAGPRVRFVSSAALSSDPAVQARLLRDLGLDGHAFSEMRSGPSRDAAAATGGAAAEAQALYREIVGTAAAA